VPEPPEQQFLLATLPPSRGQIRLALGIAAAFLVSFGITAPFAKTPLLRLDGFVPAHQGIYAVNDLVTSALLFAQFSIVRRWALLALAIGFLYTALLAILHALAFPGAFSPTGLLGAKAQTTAWLYNFWKLGLPLAVIVYALLKDADVRTGISERSPRVVILWSVAGVVAIVCALTWVSIARVDDLPTILSSDAVQYSQGAERVIGIFQVSLCVVALTFLWIRWSSLLDQWLLVLSFTLVLEVAMSTLLASARFDLGWYAARGFALAASLVVLLVLLSETMALYANLALSVMRRRGERQARQIAMDAMAASVAHEVHQPLGSIVLNAEAALHCLTSARPDLDDARAALQDVIDDAHRAGQVIFGIRSMFKKGATGRLLLDANDLVREVLDMVELDLRKHRVLVTTDLRDGLPQLRADRGQLQQVFLNLIVNAIEAMGSLTDRARALRVSSDIVREPSGVMIAIEDSGIGIKGENRDRIFEPFVTTKSTGTGIGLHISRSIIESHRGTLRVSGNKPYGTIFHVTLPSSDL
jgi:signal transduction histidine kinase